MPQITAEELDNACWPIFQRLMEELGDRYGKIGWWLSNQILPTIFSVKTTMKYLLAPERDTRTVRFSHIASTKIRLSTRFEFEYGGI